MRDYYEQRIFRMYQTWFAMGFISFSAFALPFTVRLSDVLPLGLHLKFVFFCLTEILIAWGILQLIPENYR